MRILVIAATKQEIEGFSCDNGLVDIVITGVGVPATLFHLQKILLATHYDLVVQAGIAGAFKKDLELGQPVIIGRDTFADLGIEEQNRFTPIFKSSFMNKDEFPYSEGWLVNSGRLAQQLNLPVVTGVTINKVSDSRLQINQFETNFNPDAESMEGAALHYVCLQENVPFIQLRSLSNYVGERNKANWKLKESIDNLGEALFNLVKTASE